MNTPSAEELDAIALRYPDVFSGSLRRMLIAWSIVLGIVAYFIFAWWFFAVGAVFASGNWGIAGAYLADWVTYEVRPNIDFEEGRLEVGYPRYSAYRPDRNPDWVSIDDDLSHAVVRIGSDASLDIRPNEVVVTRGDETLIVAILPGQRVSAKGTMPSWAAGNAAGDEVTVHFGFSGRADIESDEIKIHRRFFGWENFFFDGNSPFWGKTLGEVVSLIVSGPRIDPERSNAALALSNILNNEEWQHGDVWLKLLQTIVMAFVGTVLASLVAFPLAFLAARNITPNRLANQLLKRFFDFQRSVDMLIWALFFTRAFGPGPLAGMSAIFFTDTGTFGKLYSEALENIDDKQREGIRSVGASPAVVQRYGVLPQVLPVFLSQSLYFWESNTRSATIIGAVGAGGIGLKLWEAMRTNQDWENVAYMVLLILVVVFVFDNISNALRRRLMGVGGMEP